MKTKLIGIIFIMLICTLFAGCMPVEAMVQPDTVAEIREYVRNEYGGADLLYYEESDKSMLYHFKDRQFGFEYNVISSITPVTLDNTIFGYEETKKSNFLENYKKCLWGKLILDDVPECVSVDYFDSSTEDATTLGYITVPDKFYTDEGATVAFNIGRQLRTLDYRRFLYLDMLVIRDKSGEYLGYFDMEGGKVIVSEHTARNYFVFHIEDILNTEDVVMFESEHMYLRDVPGLENVKLEKDLNPDEHIVTVYYFISENKWYFIADIKALYRQNYREVPMWYIYNTTDEKPYGYICRHPVETVE
jgi:hypothetical protein